ncbi:tRNA pseudouridine(55) synthase TruB [Acetilactobacillus jinshanensis]|uniref:tRNA pseudouridine synthase B n=1 Tax=Acetilactobacillus jinshanensis TaxID=1720083 RepID=A0A4P6ZJP5_9LACO|nr:tRNA pseudouridine(55) synthase TruB [Acetilactobacillus jinshanensis]QBP17961.1 tRNA pseudouridine(55) synthase TruB [Acetilactobacillus jinshanensis]URL60824.1 tRNA pseudouridine(55) synthase TruB [uncultured bacterium]
MNGIIPLYKPRGMTSFHCVSKIRHLLNIRKVGHSGTLDPDVDGVLPICVGSATKVAGYLMHFGKVYQGSVTLGLATDTADLSGNVIKTEAIAKPYSNKQIDKQMKTFEKDRLVQVPPMYSAVRVNGKHLYEYARQGIKVDRPKHIVSVKSFKQIKPSQYDRDKKQQTIYFRIVCGKGTYIRCMSVDLGKKLGVPAVMSNLTRVKSGNFHLDQTVTFGQIKHDLEDHDLSFLAPIEHALPEIPVYNLKSSQWARVKNGAFLYPDEVPNYNKLILKYNHDTKALYGHDVKQKCYRPITMFSIK